MPTTSIPIIDISPFRADDPQGAAQVVAAVKSACEEIGFFMVSGHGVDDAFVERVYKTATGFFERPEDEKMRFAKPSPQVNRGYTAFKSRTVGRDRNAVLKPSLQEGYAMGMMDVPNDSYFYTKEAGANFAANIWPDEPSSFQPALRQYYGAMEGLAATIMRIFAAALEVPEQFFASKLDKHISTLRLVYYPALDQAPDEGEERAGAHTDTGTLTILRIDDTPRSLQVQNRAGKWLDVQRVPGAFIINIGDMMMRWTNDRWVSTLHRVMNPPVIDGKSSPRLSIVFFNQPNYDAMIECIPTCCGPDNPPRYPPVTSGEHRLRRYAQTYGFEIPKVVNQ